MFEMLPLPCSKRKFLVDCYFLLLAIARAAQHQSAGGQDSAFVCYFFGDAPQLGASPHRSYLFLCTVFWFLSRGAVVARPGCPLPPTISFHWGLSQRLLTLVF
jgi:hypothetical protein